MSQAFDREQITALKAPHFASNTNSLQAEALALATWFALHKRDLPWRAVLPLGTEDLSVREPASDFNPVPQRDPYATWISEIMLQQTQVSTVIDYFTRWMIRFPDVETLAAAGEKEVLEAWAGLGYYSRARNLLVTARTIAGEFGGKFPWQREGLMKLKGIGEYTAGAIASLAFNRPEPILDGNLIRVFSRLYGLPFLADTREGKAAYWNWARAWVHSHDPATVNEGLMELGATVCTPNQPNCDACPLTESCMAWKTGSQDRFPPAKPRKDTVDIAGFAVAAIRAAEGPGGGEVMMYRPRKPELLAGLLTFPVFTVSDLPSLRVAWSQTFPGLEAPTFRAYPTAVSHGITHHRIRLQVVSAAWTMETKSMPLPEGYLWAPLEDLDKLLVSSLPRKIWKVFR